MDHRYKLVLKYDATSGTEFRVSIVRIFTKLKGIEYFGDSCFLSGIIFACAGNFKF